MNDCNVRDSDVCVTHTNWDAVPPRSLEISKDRMREIDAELSALARLHAYAREQARLAKRFCRIAEVILEQCGCDHIFYRYRDQHVLFIWPMGPPLEMSLERFLRIFERPSISPLRVVK
ncbi:MAG: hypothetical protein WC866_04235 [Patescibacteria group bacterium]